jgi:hypothetical protein
VADSHKFSAASFYPGRDGPTATSHAQIHVDIARENDPFVVSYGNDSEVESEDEWFDDTHIEDVAPKNVSKMSEATWDSSVNLTGSGVGVASTTRGSNFATSHKNGTSGGDNVLTYPPVPTNSPSPMPTKSLMPTNPSTPKPIWPSDTEIACFQGRTKYC